MRYNAISLRRAEIEKRTDSPPSVINRQITLRQREEGDEFRNCFAFLVVAWLHRRSVEGSTC
jgi:hypothetical protein